MERVERRGARGWGPALAQTAELAAHQQPQSLTLAHPRWAQTSKFICGFWTGNLLAEFTFRKSLQLSLYPALQGWLAAGCRGHPIARSSSSWQPGCLSSTNLKDTEAVLIVQVVVSGLYASRQFCEGSLWSPAAFCPCSDQQHKCATNTHACVMSESTVSDQDLDTRGWPLWSPAISGPIQGLRNFCGFKRKRHFT